METKDDVINEAMQIWPHLNERMPTTLKGNKMIWLKNDYGLFLLKNTGSPKGFPPEHSLYEKIKEAILEIPICTSVFRSETGLIAQESDINKLIKSIDKYNEIRNMGEEEYKNILRERKEKRTVMKKNIKEGVFYGVDETIIKKVIKENNWGNNNFKKSILKIGSRFFLFADSYTINWRFKKIYLVFSDSNNTLHILEKRADIELSDWKMMKNKDIIEEFLNVGYEEDKRILEQILVLESI